MTKLEYLETIKKIDNLASRYYEEEPEWESPEMKDIWAEVDSLHLGEIKLHLTPKKEEQETTFYVVLDPEYEFPDLYEIPKESFEEVSNALYQIYTDYQNYSEFYDAVGIEFESLIALVINCRELPIVSATRNVEMNNVRYWNSNPYSEGLLSMVADELQPEQDSHGLGR